MFDIIFRLFKSALVRNPLSVLLQVLLAFVRELSTEKLKQYIKRKFSRRRRKKREELDRQNREDLHSKFSVYAGKLTHLPNLHSGSDLDRTMDNSLKLVSKKINRYLEGIGSCVSSPESSVTWLDGLNISEIEGRGISHPRMV